MLATITAALMMLCGAATVQAEGMVRHIHEATISLVSLDRQMIGRLTSIVSCLISCTWSTWAYRASRSSRSPRRTRTPQAATRTRRRRRIPLPRLRGSERLPTRMVLLGGLSPWHPPRVTVPMTRRPTPFAFSLQSAHKEFAIVLAKSRENYATIYASRRGLAARGRARRRQSEKH